MSTYEQRLLDKLKIYEHRAYSGGFGADWLEEIGEGFRHYIEKCIATGEIASINGFITYLDGIAPEPEKGA